MRIQKFELQIVTMNCNDINSLLNKMNVSSNVSIGNQNELDRVEKFKLGNHYIRVYSFNEKGVGLNRNNILMRTSSEFVLFADDDEILVDNYENIVIDTFARLNDADVIVFNLREKINKRPLIIKQSRVRWYNFMRYGTARLAVRSKSIKLNGIYFNECFGGGTEHSHGEDTLFLAECLRKGLKIYAVPITIAELGDDRDSTWDDGNLDKYLSDQGVLYKVMSRHLFRLLCAQDAIRHSKKFGSGIMASYKKMIEGANSE